jgi:hypothetical protein
MRERDELCFFNLFKKNSVSLIYEENKENEEEKR